MAMKGQPKSFPLTDAEFAQVIELWRAGWTSVEIGARFGITSRRVKYLMQRDGIRSPLGNVRRKERTVREKLPPEEPPAPAKPLPPRAEIRRLANKGVGLTAIAALLKCPYREVARALETNSAG
jgi:hypothetical protein